MSSEKETPDQKHSFPTFRSRRPMTIEDVWALEDEEDMLNSGELPSPWEPETHS